MNRALLTLMDNAAPSGLGARPRPGGAEFALYSEHAERVELRLFEAGDGADIEVARLDLPQCTGGVWHGYFPGIKSGQRYGFAVHGPYAPGQGHRFNANKLLIDPYAKLLSGELIWNDAVYEAGPAAGGRVLPDKRDSAEYVPKSVLVDDEFEWQGDRPPRVPWSETVVYECHVKGLTRLHPQVPEEFRGTYLGLASEVVVSHLLRLGVTTVELLPVHHAVDERALVERGLVNYWGYNPMAFFAPATRYAARGHGTAIEQFKTMVKALHRAGLEVIIDVVFNHTAEMGEGGPMLSMRGIDNATYYRLERGDPRRYEDFSGCGNTLNVRHPRVLQMVMDCLRYWVEVMHVDGFRFDLAPVLARGDGGFERDGPFFCAVLQDPVLAGVKLIAEPWDLGPNGYQLGGFPTGWSEWNDRYRSAVRSFWRGDEGILGEMGKSLAGSSDVFQSRHRRPSASINYVTCHDGFTLEDLVSYDRKHNERNGENNKDGTDENLSANWGTEGPTNEPQIHALRDQIKRGLMATLAFSRGVPMISSGDEFGRSQRGNNNAYCQDNEVSWLDWRLDERQEAFLAFLIRVLGVRKQAWALRADVFLSGQVGLGGLRDVTWLRPDGAEFSHSDWHDRRRHVLGMMVHAAKEAVANRTQATAARLETFLAIFNGGSRGTRFLLPVPRRHGRWFRILDTAVPAADRRVLTGKRVDVHARSLVLLEHEYDS